MNTRFIHTAHLHLRTTETNTDILAAMLADRGAFGDTHADDIYWSHMHALWDLVWSPAVIERRLGRGKPCFPLAA